MSTFLVPPDQVDNFLDGFKKQFAIMRKQPGLISAQLYRGTWESVDAFRYGYELPEFPTQLKQYPPGTVVSACFFQRVAVAGMCLGEGTRESAIAASTKIVKNELHKLAATFFNNIAVGCVLLGLVARLASLKISLAVKADSPSPSGLCAKPLGLVLKE